MAMAAVVHMAAVNLDGMYQIPFDLEDHVVVASMKTQDAVCRAVKA